MAQVRIKPQDIINEYAVNLGNKLRIKKIILFGSASRGRLGRDSDLDIIVLSV
jgi:predicted nucleotidyltransferase